MKEFKNKVQIVPLADIESISGTTLSLKTGKSADEILTSNDIIPDEKGQVDNGSRFYTQSLNVICDKLPSVLHSKYRNRKVVVKLFDDQDGEYLMGGMQYPARISLEPKLNQDKLSITCETTNSLVS